MALVKYLFDIHFTTLVSVVLFSMFNDRILHTQIDLVVKSNYVTSLKSIELKQVCKVRYNKLRIKRVGDKELND